MKQKLRRQFPGEFTTRQLANGAWRLSRIEPTPVDIFLRNTRSAAVEVLRPRTVNDVEIDWGAGPAVLTLTSAGRRTAIESQSVIVHEPLAHLYDALPLAVLDGKARRFWRTVFRLIRIPGGRHLLGVLARRMRDRR